MNLCPCGSGHLYSECCEPYITHVKNPPTAESLMRSRYSAYAKQVINYLVATCVQEGTEKIDLSETRKWSEESEWLGLAIVSVSGGGVEDTEGTVEFKAYYRRDRIKDVHHERAVFVKSNGKWLYRDGRIIQETVVRAAPKIGRNDPCPCGSGKKYKQCCGQGHK
jgi:SEC-C motif-containing protein